MTKEELEELAKDICDPVYHLLPEVEYIKWFDAVVDRLVKEFGDSEAKSRCTNTQLREAISSLDQRWEK